LIVLRALLEKREGCQMKYIWFFGSVASIYGAIAGSFFDKAPLTAVAFALLAIVFALAAWRDVSKKP
jgi:membrane protein implicated in regulation of membrane protease activity